MLKTMRTTPRRKGKATPRIKAGRVEDAHRLAAVASLPCCICGDRPVEVHHIRDGQVGTGQRAGDDETIPLCSYCHRTGGPGIAFHSGPRQWESLYGPQREHLARTNERLKSQEAA